MKNIITLRNMRGVALLEVLIAAVVLAGGLIALAQFQGNMLQSSGQSKARATAAKLAQEKIDDLRGYSTVEAGAAGAFGFAEIGNDLGGAEDVGGALRVPSGLHSVSGEDFTLSWAADSRWFCADNSAAVSAACSAGAESDFKEITVTVTWNDVDGSNSVVLESVVEASDPAAEANVLAATSETGPGPDVSYTPGAAPEVLPVDVGDGENTETSNPRPTIETNSDFPNTISKFSTVKYLDNGDGTFETIAREEFITIDCQCALQNSASPDNTSSLDLKGDEVSKAFIGKVTTLNQQSRYCVSCCRDHAEPPSCDPSTSNGRNSCFDPWRPAAGYSGTAGTNLNHRHYSDAGVEATAQDNLYVESCRYTRIDGLLRVVQDWRLIDLQVFPENFLTTDANIDAYGNFIGNVIRDYLVPGTPADLQRPSLGISGAGNGGTFQFLGRGIYLDYMDTSAVGAVASRISADPTDNTVLQDIPFYEINITKLSGWSADQVQWDSDTSDPNNPLVLKDLVTVSNDAIVDEDVGEDNYSRGLVTATADSTGFVKLNTPVRAFNNFSNSGLLGKGAIDPWDGPYSLNGNTPVYTYSVAGAESISVQPAMVISGALIPKLANTIFDIVDTGTFASSGCTYINGPGSYACTVSSGWTGTITPMKNGVQVADTKTYSTAVTANKTGEDYARY